MKKETMAEAKVQKEFILGILFDAVECCLYGAFVWRVFSYLGTDGSIFDDQNV
jgi:hypothetical protein